MRNIALPARLLVAVTLVCGLAVTAIPAPRSAFAAISGTVGQPQVIAAPSGVTTVELPSQVESGGVLRVLVHTVPFAKVRLTIAYPDGTAIKASHHAGRTGYATFTPTIEYQPQGSTELATVTVLADLNKAGLNDTVQGSVSIAQHAVLPLYLKLPPTVAAGRSLSILLGTLPGATVRFVLIYPDQQVEHRWGGVVDASGILTRTIHVSASDGTRGTLDVEALVSYNGVERHKWGRVALRAPNS